RPPRTKPGKALPHEVVRTALCIEVRNGHLHAFLPPLKRAEDFINLIATIENVTQSTGLCVRIEGYGPPSDPRIRVLNVTPDPGVIEVNIHPSASWEELAANTFSLYEEARQARLGTEK